jgi:YD repeat-containing protein
MRFAPSMKFNFNFFSTAFLTGIFAVLSPHFVDARIDMKNFNFVESWVDFHLSGTGYDLEIKRTYNSRSLYNGRLGFGWCSNFETSLLVNPEGNIKISECGAGKETLYSAKEVSRIDTEKTVAAIIAKFRAENRSASADSIKQLESELLETERVRTRYAKKYGINATVNQSTVYRANGIEGETVTIEKNFYLRSFVDGSYQRFNFQGQLIANFDRFGNYTKFDYDNTGIKEMVDSQGRRITFKNVNGKISQAILPNGGKIEYVYENIDDLAKVKTPTGEYTYSYDEFHNLNKAKGPNGESFSIVYDNTNDWVTSFTDKSGCVESYSVEVDQKSPKMHYWTYLRKVCKGEEVVKNSFEFLYKQRKSGETYLAQATSKEGSDESEYKIHEVFGKPTFIRKNDHLAEFTYEKDGRLKTKTVDGTGTFAYTYYPDGKVREVKYTEKRNKATLRVTSSFRYEKGNLSFAENTEGQKIRIKYDQRGRIFEIEDQAKKVVRIEYDQRFTSQPSKLTRPGLGSVNIPYKSNGDMGQAESPEGPSVAAQIVMVFNNYFDLVSLAQPEASL